MDIVWHNGKLIQKLQAFVSIDSPAIRYSHSIFDGCKVYIDDNKECFYINAVDQHIDRFMQSCKKLHLKLDFSPEQLKKGILDVVKNNSPNEDVGLRLFALNAKGDFCDQSPADTYIYLLRLNNYAPNRPLNLTISKHMRSSNGDLSKSIKSPAHYAFSRIAVIEAKQNGFDDVIFINEKGALTESSRSTAIFLKNNEFVVPPPSEGILPGITRMILKKIIQSQNNLKFIERPISLSDLPTFESGLLCSSSLGVVEISSIDNLIFRRSSHIRDIIIKHEETMRGKNKSLHSILTTIPILKINEKSRV